MNLYYRRDGTHYPEGDEGLLQWAKDFSNFEYKRVADTILPDGKRVSTIWLGLDHNFGSEKLHIFESMVFPSKSEFTELATDRYETEAEAIKGHARLVKRFSKQEKTPGARR